MIAKTLHILQSFETCPHNTNPKNILEIRTLAREIYSLFVWSKKIGKCFIFTNLFKNSSNRISITLDGIKNN